MLTQLGQQPFSAPFAQGLVGGRDRLGLAPTAWSNGMGWAEAFAARNVSLTAEPMQIAQNTLGGQLTPATATAISRAEVARRGLLHPSDESGVPTPMTQTLHLNRRSALFAAARTGHLRHLPRPRRPTPPPRATSPSASWWSSSAAGRWTASPSRRRSAIANYQPLADRDRHRRLRPAERRAAARRRRSACIPGSRPCTRWR